MTSRARISHIDVFRQSPIAILCEDWSAIRSVVLRARAEAGGDDAFDRLLERDPSYFHRLRGLHRIVDANPAALDLLGVTDLAALTEAVGHLLPADPNGHVIRAIARGERHCRGERELVSSTGTRTPILWQTTLPEHAEDFSRVYFFAVDISEQKRAQEANDTARAALNHAGRLSLVGELVASMTHEVSQPVSSISLLAEAASRWLAQTPPNLQEAKTFVGRIVNSANHAAQVIRRIRDFSRASATRYAPVAPAELIADAVALVEHEGRRLGIQLLVDMAPDLPPVSADPIQIKQVIVNIAINAFQAMAAQDQIDRPRRVTFAAEAGRGHVLFRIKDTGPGIADATRALEPFFSTKTEGLGLGLSICKRITEEHGGELRLSSDSGGAELCFTLPIAIDASGRCGG